MISLIGITVLLQFIAACQSVRMIRITGKRSAWALIAIAITIGALRRSADLIKLIFAHKSVSSDMTSELLSLVTSICMLAGVAFIAPVFGLLKKSEERTEAKYRYLFENIPQKIFYKDRDSVYVAVNPSYARDFNVLPDDFVGKSDYDFFPKELAEKYRSDDMHIMRSGKAECDESYLYAGKEKTVHTVKIPVREDAGNVAGIMGIFWDITERKQAEDVLKRAQEIAHLGSWEFDLVNNRLNWSDEAYRIFGLQPQEFGATYEAFLEAVHPEDRTAVDAAYYGSIRDGKDSYDIEHRLVRKSTGEIRFVHEKCEHFRDTSGKIVRSVGMVHDITERRKAEESLQQRTAELERVNRELESFIYSASHDLRAPLRTISGFAEIVAKRYSGQLDENGGDYLLRICKGTARMGRIIDELLRLSKVSRQEIERKPVDLSEMAASIIADFRDADPGRQVEVSIQKGLMVHADPGLMEVSLSNLLENAWKFTSKTQNARIEFGAVEQDGQTLYLLRDNGAGFDQKHAGRMFWPFHRLHSGSEFDGTGIGLAIVERIINGHGGKIWAGGEVGKGATISFTLG